MELAVTAGSASIPVRAYWETSSTVLVAGVRSGHVVSTRYDPTGSGHAACAERPCAPPMPSPPGTGASGHGASRRPGPAAQLLTVRWRVGLDRVVESPAVARRRLRLALRAAREVRQLTRG